MKNFCKQIPALLICCMMFITVASAVTNYSGWKNTQGLNAIEYKEETTRTPASDKVSSISPVETEGNLTYASLRERFTAEDMKIHVNENNMTYGKAIVAFATDAQIDLISAIGQNGVEGYIYSSQLPRNIENYIPHDHTIPVYASDGVTVVDSFFISSGVPGAAE